MRSVFGIASRGAALVAIVLLLAAPMLYADDFNPNQPPEARIQPPGGLTVQARIQPPGGWTELVRLVWQLAKIGPMR